MIAFALMLIPFLMAASCKKETAIPAGLLHTWKLEGMQTAETPGSLKKLEPADCDKCYTLTFKSNGTFSGKSAINILQGRFSVKEKNIHFPTIGGTLVGEIGDPVFFTDHLKKVFRYEMTGSKLKLFYSSSEYYLFI